MKRHPMFEPSRPMTTVLRCLACIVLVSVMAAEFTSDGADGSVTLAITGAVALADRIGDKRREVTGLTDQRRELLEKAGQLEEEEAALQAKQELSEEESKRLEAISGEIRDAYAQARKLNEAIERGRAELSELEDRQRARDEQTRHEIQLGLAGGGQKGGGGSGPTNPVSAGAGDPHPERGGGGQSNVSVSPPSAEQQDKDIADLIRAGAACGNQPYLMTQYSRNVLQNDRIAVQLEQTMTASSNGAVIPPNYVPRLIELLTPKTVIRRAGPMLMPLDNGNNRIPKKTARASAAYYGESANIAKSTPTTTSVTLSAKKLAAVVVATGELLRRSTPSADAMIRNDLLEAVALKEDSTFLRNTDTSGKPKGLLKIATDGSTVINANGTVNAANVEADIATLMLTLEQADVPMENPYFFMSPRTKSYLARLRDALGAKVYPELANGMIGQYPVLTTTQIPNNLGTGTDESEIYFTDIAQFVLADAPTFILEANPAAAYYDGSAVQAAFSRDEVPVRIIVEHDFVARHDEAVAVLDQVTWGG